MVIKFINSKNYWKVGRGAKGSNFSYQSKRIIKRYKKLYITLTSRDSLHVSGCKLNHGL